jgi:hypothetical protein
MQHGNEEKPMCERNNSDIEPGDVLSRPKGLFNHLAVYLGKGLVLQNTPERGEHMSSLREFTRDQVFRVLKIPTTARGFVVDNAKRILQAPRPFNLFTNNCEHTVTRAMYGRGFSKQARIWGFSTLAVTLAVILARILRR